MARRHLFSCVSIVDPPLPVRGQQLVRGVHRREVTVRLAAGAACGRQPTHSLAMALHETRHRTDAAAAVCSETGTALLPPLQALDVMCPHERTTDRRRKQRRPKRRNQRRRQRRPKERKQKTPQNDAQNDADNDADKDVDKDANKDANKRR